MINGVYNTYILLYVDTKAIPQRHKYSLGYYKKINGAPTGYWQYTMNGFQALCLHIVGEISAKLSRDSSRKDIVI